MGLLLLAALVAGAGYLLWWRELERVRDWQDRARAAERRAAALEFQMVSYVARVLAVPRPPVPEEFRAPEPALPKSVADFLGGLDDPDARAEYEALWRQEVAANPGVSPAEWVQGQLARAARSG
jgi:hypothetical protein